MNRVQVALAAFVITIGCTAPAKHVHEESSPLPSMVTASPSSTPTVPANREVLDTAPIGSVVDSRSGSRFTLRWSDATREGECALSATYEVPKSAIRLVDDPWRITVVLVGQGTAAWPVAREFSMPGADLSRTEYGQMLFHYGPGVSRRCVSALLVFVDSEMVTLPLIDKSNDANRPRGGG